MLWAPLSLFKAIATNLPPEISVSSYHPSQPLLNLWRSYQCSHWKLMKIPTKPPWQLRKLFIPDNTCRPSLDVSSDFFLTIQVSRFWQFIFPWCSEQKITFVYYFPGRDVGWFCLILYIFRRLIVVTTFRCHNNCPLGWSFWS